MFKEIEDEIRREKFEKIWRVIGKWAIYGSITIIIATIGFVVWENRNNEHSEEKTAVLIKSSELIESGNYKAGITVISPLTDDAGSKYYALAMLQKARAQELSGDADGAQKTYLLLAKNKNDFSDLAKIKSLNDNEITKISSSSPFYYSAQENNAWKLLRIGKESESADIFISLIDDKNTPQSMVSRAREILSVIAPEKLGSKK